MTAETRDGAGSAPLAGVSNSLVTRLGRAVPALPGLAVLLFLFLVPMAIMFVFSFWHTNTDFRIVPDWNLDNYARFFTEGTYLRTFFKTLVMGSIVTLAALAIGLPFAYFRSEEHTSELQSHSDLVCRLLLEKKKIKTKTRRS